jgi:hypothetical protein
MNPFTTVWDEPRNVSSCHVAPMSRSSQIKDGFKRCIVLSSIYLDHMEDHLFEFVVGAEPGDRSVFTIFTNRAVMLDEHSGISFIGEGNSLDMSKYKETLMNIHVQVDNSQDYSNLNHYSGP